MRTYQLFVFTIALLSSAWSSFSTELPSVFEADGTIKLGDNYIIKPLDEREDERIKLTQVMLRRLLDSYGTKKLFSITNKPGQGDITIVLTINGSGIKDANTLAEAIFNARETKKALVFQVTSRMAGGIGAQIGPSPVDLILDAAAVDMPIKPESSQTMSAVSNVDSQGRKILVGTNIEKSPDDMLVPGKSPFQPPNVDRREFISTLLPNIMGDQLVAVGYSEGSFNVNGVRNPQSKRIARHRALDSVEWYDQWLIGAKARDTNYAWDDSENWTLHPAGGVSNPDYESLLKQTRVASGGIPRNSFLECIVNDVAVLRETEVQIEGVKEAKGKIWFAPLALFTPAQQRYMKKEYWRLMPECSSLQSALAKNDPFAKICANEYRFVDHKILQEAAAQGDSDALNVLGRCYLDGVCYSDLLREAGEGNISRWLPSRVSVPKDTFKAVELLKAAAEKGSIDACIALGEYLCKQPDQAHLGRLYYLIAAYVGHPLAHLNLALKYRNMKDAIANMTGEQRARRAVWHLLCAVNCNREFMSLRVRGETLRVMCYDLAGDMLDGLEDSLLREYAKIEMQKLKVSWPMKWDRVAANFGAGILASAEELQNEMDTYFKSGASSLNGGVWTIGNSTSSEEEPQDASAVSQGQSFDQVGQFIAKRAQVGAGKVVGLKEVLSQVRNIELNAESSALVGELGLPSHAWERGLIPGFNIFWRSASIPGLGSYFLTSQYGHDALILKQLDIASLGWVGVLPANYGSVAMGLNYPFVNLNCTASGGGQWHFSSEGSPVGNANYPSRFGIKSMKISDFIREGAALLKANDASHFVFSISPLYPNTGHGVFRLYCISPSLLKGWMKHRKTPVIDFLQFGDTISDVESKLVKNGFLLGMRMSRKLFLDKRVMFGSRKLEAKQNSLTILTNGADVCSRMDCSAVGMMFDVPIVINMSFSTYFPDCEDSESVPDMFLVKAELNFFPESLARGMPDWLDADQADIGDLSSQIRGFFAKTTEDLRRQKRISLQSELEKLMSQAGFKRREAVKLWERQRPLVPDISDSLICEVAPRNPTFDLLKDNVHAYFDDHSLLLSDEAGMMLSRASLEYFEWLNVVLEVLGLTNQVKKNPFLPK